MIGLFSQTLRGGVGTRMKMIERYLPDAVIFTDIDFWGNYDLVHLNWQNPIDIIFKLKKPYVITFHGWLPLGLCTNFDAKWKHLVRKSIYSYLVKRADRVIAVSEFAKSQLKGIRKDVDVVYAGIPVEEYKVKKKRNEILFLNSLEKYENPQVLVKAMRRLPHDYRLKIFGEGRMFEDLRDASANMSIHAEVSNKEIREHISRARIIVQPALQETFGFPIIEGMASGCICIVSDIPAHRECFDNVVFFNPNDDEDLAKKIDKAMRGDYNYLLKDAVEEVYEKYHVNRFIKEIKKIYDEVLE